jgi:glycosidase
VKHPIERLIQHIPVLKSLDIDTLWFLPFHPTGIEKRKGKLGSPYAIRDYKQIDSTIGSMQQLEDLINILKRNGFKIIMDLVFHHASPDNKIFKNKSFIHRDFLQSRLSSTWGDIVKFNFDQKELYVILLDIMKFWVEKGVDGFRCDVAPFVPIDFWEMAADNLNSNKDMNRLFLAETLSLDFYLNHVDSNTTFSSDVQISGQFSYLYAYNAYYMWQKYLAGHISTGEWVRYLNLENQLWGIPSKLCYFIENHDTPPARSYLTIPQWKIWLFFFLMQPGAFLIYNGQEYGLTRKISLFDPDPIRWEQGDEELVKWCQQIFPEKEKMITKSSLSFLYEEGPYLIHQKIINPEQTIHIYYNFSSRGYVIHVPFQEYTFSNLFDNRHYFVHNQKVNLPGYTALLISEDKTME